MGKQQFFRVLVPAVEEGLNPDTVRKGFQNCGVFPINPNAKKLKNIGANAVYDRCKLELSNIYSSKKDLRWQVLVTPLNDKQVTASG